MPTDYQSRKRQRPGADASGSERSPPPCPAPLAKPLRVNDPQVAPALPSRPIGSEIKLEAVSTQTRRLIARRSFRVIQPLQRFRRIPRLLRSNPGGAKQPPAPLFQRSLQ